MIIEVSFEHGLPEYYFLPIAFLKGNSAQNIRIEHPEAVITETQIAGEEGIICDALYIPEIHQELLKKFVHQTNSDFTAYADNELKEFVKSASEIHSKMHLGEQLNTCITYNNKYFLKIYRKVDRGVNSDVELSRYLSEQATFKHTPCFKGVLEWNLERDSIVVGLLEDLIENHGNGRIFMLERINNYIERILARDKSVIMNYEKMGTLLNPVNYDTLPEEIKEFLGGPAAEYAYLIGVRTAELHKTLAANNDKDFKPEEFSLHYQRSLFASMQSLVRETFENIEKKISRIPENLQEDVKQIISRRSEVLNQLKRIYSKKFDVVKIRIHGFYGLDEILLTGKDIMIHNFNGNPLRTFSERRLKRSPLRDVAAMIRSLYYVAHEGFLMNTQVRKEELEEILPLADYWAHYMSGFFVKGYLDTIGDEQQYIPKDPEDADVMMQTYIIENSLHLLNYELNHRPEWVRVPLSILKKVIDKKI